MECCILGTYVRNYLPKNVEPRLKVTLPIASKSEFSLLQSKWTICKTPTVAVQIFLSVLGQNAFLLFKATITKLLELFWKTCQHSSALGFFGLFSAKDLMELKNETISKYCDWISLTFRISDKFWLPTFFYTKSSLNRFWK